MKGKENMIMVIQVDLLTKAAIKEMIPSLLPVLSPIFLYFT